MWRDRGQSFGTYNSYYDTTEWLQSRDYFIWDYFWYQVASAMSVLCRECYMTAVLWFNWHRFSSVYLFHLTGHLPSMCTQWHPRDLSQSHALPVPMFLTRTSTDPLGCRNKPHSLVKSVRLMYLRVYDRSLLWDPSLPSITQHIHSWAFYSSVFIFSRIKTGEG